MNEKFTKGSRLLGKSDFEALQKGARVFYFKSFRFIVKNSQYTQARLGLAVSRKVGGAVLRNRVKRVVREQFRKNPIKKLGLDLLIIPRKDLPVEGLADQIKAGFSVVYDQFRRSKAH